MPNKVFISYSSKDRRFIERLAKDLKAAGVDVWWDEWEIKVGDSIVQKINDGIQESAYLIVVLSRSSVASLWVQEELSAATMHMLNSRSIALLPLRIEPCDIPLLLAHRKFADFQISYDHGLDQLLGVLTPTPSKWETEPGLWQLRSQILSVPQERLALADRILHRFTLHTEAVLAVANQAEAAVRSDFRLPFKRILERPLYHKLSQWLETADRQIGAILGEAGIGKSTLLRSLAYQFLHQGRCACLFVQMQGLTHVVDFATAIADWLQLPGTTFPEAVETLRDIDIRPLLFVDTLDVVADNPGLYRFLSQSVEAGATVLAACRTERAMDITSLISLVPFHLERLNEHEISTLFSGYYGYHGIPSADLHPYVKEFCSIPLHAWMLLEVYTPAELDTLDPSFDRLCEAYWERKVRHLRPGACTHLSPGDRALLPSVKERIVRAIAGLTLEAPSPTMAVDSGCVQEHLQMLYPIQSALVTAALIDLLDEGVLLRRDGHLQFFHQAFHEYALARWLLARRPSYQEYRTSVKDHFHFDPGWNAIRLALCEAQDMVTILQMAFEAHYELQLMAAQCLTKLAEQYLPEVHRLLNKLSRGNIHARRVSLRVAHSLPPQEAIPVLLRALKESEPSEGFLRDEALRYATLGILEGKLDATLVEKLLSPRHILATRGGSFIDAIDLTIRVGSSIENVQAAGAVAQVWEAWLSRNKLTRVWRWLPSRIKTRVIAFAEGLSKQLFPLFPAGLRQLFEEMPAQERAKLGLYVRFLNPDELGIETVLWEIGDLLQSRSLIKTYLARQILNVHACVHFRIVEPLLRHMLFESGSYTDRYDYLGKKDYQEKEWNRLQVCSMSAPLAIVGEDSELEPFLCDLSRSFHPQPIHILTIWYAKHMNTDGISSTVDLVKTAVDEGNVEEAEYYARDLAFVAVLYPEIALQILERSGLLKFEPSRDQVAEALASTKLLHPDKTYPFLQRCRQRSTISDQLLAQVLRTEDIELIAGYLIFKFHLLFTLGLVKFPNLRNLFIEIIYVATQADTLEQCVAELLELGLRLPQEEGFDVRELLTPASGPSVDRSPSSLLSQHPQQDSCGALDHDGA